MEIVENLQQNLFYFLQLIERYCSKVSDLHSFYWLNKILRFSVNKIAVKDFEKEKVVAWLKINCNWLTQVLFVLVFLLHKFILLHVNNLDNKFNIR